MMPTKTEFCKLVATRAKIGDLIDAEAVDGQAYTVIEDLLNYRGLTLSRENAGIRVIQFTVH